MPNVVVRYRTIVVVTAYKKITFTLLDPKLSLVYFQEYALSTVPFQDCKLFRVLEHIRALLHEDDSKRVSRGRVQT